MKPHPKANKSQQKQKANKSKKPTKANKSQQKPKSESQHQKPTNQKPQKPQKQARLADWKTKNKTKKILKEIPSLEK